MSEDTADTPEDEGERSARDRIGEGADRARSGFDERVVDILSWMLDTETRARIYVYLRQHPWSTSEEVAEGTGLYPSTVREALAELATEDTVERRKRESEGAGNNPYEYTAIAPSDLVGGVVGGVQDELNTIFTLGSEDGADGQPVRIEVDEDDEEDGVEGDAATADESDERNA
ncbi:helix-turn-helix domain-containing protein [Halarchaeum salinum]|uniref:Winged helix-turn-helix domain-containing protein n=1 Tax=Halarchaeum salinum TaxID=489912 RepID=A0AAV3S6Q6_9EURY